MEEWHPQYGEFVLPFTIYSLGKVSFNTGYGKVVMQVDSNALEMIGAIERSIPTMYLHLKRIPNPPPPQYTVQEISIKSDSISLYGHLHEPKVPGKTAMIIVGGRSCYADSTKYALNAKLLREYGISVLVCNKRGTGQSTGDCTRATIADLSQDVVACKKYLEQHPNQYDNIGVLGSGAGGWVMAKA